MISFSLQSGSNGNSFYVETEDTRLLFDAGITARMAQRRLAEKDRDIKSVDAMFISHNHSDHVCHAGVYNRKYAMPIYISHGSWNASRQKVGIVREVNCFSPGETIAFGQTRVQTIPTPHDGVEPVAFIISHGQKQLGIFTDLGHCFPGLAEHIQTLDGLYLESNYDPDMLDSGPYPLWLKRRIRGDGGHLSNHEASQLVSDCAKKLQFLVLAHLSEHNNIPELALQTAKDRLGTDYPISLAGRKNVGETFTIE